MIEHISHQGRLYAIIVSRRYCRQGVNFFTPDDFSQQLAFIKHSRGKVIEPHLHRLVKREIQFTKEVLLIRSGRLRVDFYDDGNAFVCSRTLEAGDTILLSEGGHGFEVLEDVEMIEVKQGPYAGDSDKVRFVPTKAQS